MNSKANSGTSPENHPAERVRRKSAAERRREDDLVESALYRRAIGYEDAAGKEIPPDVRAALFWLKKRRPETWGDEEKNKEQADSGITFSETENSL